jgi:hypothetical protein
MPLHDAELAAIVNGLVPGIREQLTGDLAALADRITALEAKPSVRFRGVWRPDKTYTKGDAAVRSGSLWICNRDTADTAGEPGRGDQTDGSSLSKKVRDVTLEELLADARDQLDAALEERHDLIAFQMPSTPRSR